MNRLRELEDWPRWEQSPVMPLIGKLGTALLLLALAACDEKKAETASDAKLLETVTLVGTCKEDHANLAGEYKATVQRWEKQKPGQAPEVVSLGTAMSTRDPMKDLQDLEDRLKNSSTYPDAMGQYTPPFIVDLYWIDIDTSASRWVLHGMSEKGEGESGYATTCDLMVVTRTAGGPAPGVSAPSTP